jgi:hypothetical protein
LTIQILTKSGGYTVGEFKDHLPRHSAYSRHAEDHPVYCIQGAVEWSKNTGLPKRDSGDDKEMKELQLYVREVPLRSEGVLNAEDMIDFPGSTKMRRAPTVPSNERIVSERFDA